MCRLDGVLIRGISYFHRQFRIDGLHGTDESAQQWQHADDDPRHQWWCRDRSPAPIVHGRGGQHHVAKVWHQRADRIELRATRGLGLVDHVAHVLAPLDAHCALDLASPRLARWAGYLRKGGPGYLQSALTLGGGSASASLFAGAAFGYQLLWVAPTAMLIGMVMMMAIAHQTLSTGMRPFEAMRSYAGVKFAYGWAIGAMLASIIWHFSQYALASVLVTEIASQADITMSKGIGGGIVLAWARALGEFGATITFAGNFPGVTQTLPLAVYSALEVSRDEALALSLVLLAVSLTVLISLRGRFLGSRS